jgi:nicotinamidase-related amidase
MEGSAGVQFSPEVAPIEGDIIVTKRRVSGFSGSDLDVVLRGLGVEKLAVAGVATSGAVLSTVRQAADLDFDITVLPELCYDHDPEVHRVLVDKIFTRQAHVLPAEEWLRKITSDKV